MPPQQGKADLEPHTDANAPHMTTVIRRMVQLCADAQIPVTVEPDTGFCARITLGARQHMLIGADPGLNSSAARRVCEDKTFAGTFLRRDGIPTVPMQTVTDCQQIDLDRVGLPLVTKPNRGFGGKGVLRVDDKTRLPQAFDYARQFDDRVIVSPLIDRREYRLIVFRDACWLAYERRPLEITGDGRRTIRQWIASINKDRRSQARIDPDDVRIGFALDRIGLSTGAIPAPGQRIEPFFSANLKCGGTCTDCTENVADGYVKLAVAATRSLGLTWAGVDILARDISAFDDQGMVLEVNANPGFEFYRSRLDRLDRLLCEVLGHLRRGVSPDDSNRSPTPHG